MEAAQNNCTRDNVTHSQVNHHQLLFGNWNILTFIEKEVELVEEAKRYHLDIVGVSSTKRRGSGTVGILRSPRLSDWVFPGSQVCILKLKVKNQSICLLEVYAPSAASEYQAFVDEVNNALHRVSPFESIVLMGDFNAHT